MRFARKGPEIWRSCFIKTRILEQRKNQMYLYELKKGQSTSFQAESENPLVWGSVNKIRLRRP